MHHVRLRRLRGSAHLVRGACFQKAARLVMRFEQREHSPAQFGRAGARLVQIGVAVAWRRRDSIPDEFVLPWLYKTASYVLSNHRRRLLTAA